MKRLLLIIFFLPSLAMAQTTISGTVTDKKGEPVLGANVYLKDTYDGVSTGLEGEFTFDTFESGEFQLVISSIGFQEFTQPVNLDGTPVKIEATLKISVQQLNAVVITAGSFNASDESKQVIMKSLDIATTAGATADIAGALNTLPGTQTVGESGRLFVRGGDGYETKTYIDGMQVLNDYSPAAPNTPSRNRFSPFIFKGTSFSTGAYSAEYGQALSSALILESKDVALLDRTDISLMTVGADVSHTAVGDKSSFAGKLQYTNLTPYFKLLDQRINWDKAPESVDGNFAYRHKTSETGIFKIYGNLSHSNMDLYESEILTPEIQVPIGIKNNYSYINGMYKELLSDKLGFKGGASFTYNQNQFYRDGDLADLNEAGGHFKGVFDYTFSERVSLKFGSEVFVRDYTQEFGNETGSFTEGFDENIQALFAELDVFASANFVVRAGGRLENNSLQNSPRLEPRLSMAYKTSEYGQFSFGYGKFHQSVQNEFLVSDNLLDPEKADHYILNYQVIKNKRTFRVETYYKDYRSLIKYDGVVNNPLNVTTNGEGYARGVDLFWRDNKTFNNVDYWVSYSFLDTEREYKNFPGSFTPTFASKHNFSFVYKHFIDAIDSQIGFTYSYTSGRPYHNPNLDGFNQLKTKSYQDLSFNIAYLLNPSVIVYSSVNNVLGRDNIFGYEYSDAPNNEGEFVGRAITQPAKRFIFLGVFITLSKDKTINQLPNL